MNQQELDTAYNQVAYAPNLNQIVGRYRTNSEIVRGSLGAPRRASYGPSEHEQLDIYASPQANAPINVFIHGGAWRSGAARDYAFPAELFVGAGAHYVVLDFINVLQANGSLMPMAEQVRRGVAWIYQNAPSFGGDPKRLYISGHSSGAHLAAVVLTTDWEREYGLPNDIVKGGLCVSGLYDLRPVRLSARSQYVRFTDAVEDDLSPLRHVKNLTAPLILAHGTLDTPEFQRQTRDMAATLETRGHQVKLVVGDGYNHFELLETFGNPYSPLGKAVLRQMQLS